MTVFRWIFAAVVIALVAMTAISGMKPRQPPPTPVQMATVRDPDGVLVELIGGAT